MAGAFSRAVSGGAANTDAAVDVDVIVAADVDVDTDGKLRTIKTQCLLVAVVCLLVD